MSLAMDLDLFAPAEPSTSSLFERTTTEDYALDSYQNLLFSVARFREVTGHYPSRITTVGYAMKRRRYEELHREALRWPLDVEYWKYYGIDMEDEEERERAIEGEVSCLDCCLCPRVTELINRLRMATGRMRTTSTDAMVVFWRNGGFATSITEHTLTSRLLLSSLSSWLGVQTHPLTHQLQGWGRITTLRKSLRTYTEQFSKGRSHGIDRCLLPNTHKLTNYLLTLALSKILGTRRRSAER